jgi:tetratricopeptide (TPR) repeat protein
MESLRWKHLVLLLAFGASAQQAKYDLAGQILPEARAAISLFGATAPFSASSLSDERGRFQFRQLLPGPYTVAVFVAGRGEARQTIEVGPSLSDSKGRVSVTLRFQESDFVAEPWMRRRAMVSARELAIPDRARQEYDKARKKLARRDVSGAVAHLERAVQIAPQFSAAWNNLGTIAYQTRDFVRAESHFREALQQDPRAFEPLVNLGGVLLTLLKLDEALKFNLYAILSRPHDALANSQLGMTYFALDQLDLARKYLEIAKRLDPAHFSHPQLTLAEIYWRKNDRAAAADELEDFLKRHPDWPEAKRVQGRIVQLRQ